MIVTIVRIPSVGPLTVDEARALFAKNAAGYLEVPGLVEKTFLLSDDGQEAGAVYLWRDREAAEAQFNADWVDRVTAKYGAAPHVEYFSAPVLVDCTNQVLRTDPPLRVGTHGV